MAANNDGGCGLFDPACWANDWVESAVGDAIENMAAPCSKRSVKPWPRSAPCG